MQVSEIDKDFIDIVNILNANGLRPFSSCDGVESHHTEEDKPLCAYIGLLESKKGIDLLVACLRDKSNFDVIMENNTHKEAYMLYGNRIDGNAYLIFFDNSEGERTTKLED